jgi:SAM-dependent methyltransferase
MAREQSKSAKRRFNDGNFHSKYFVGRGIDIGAGPDSLEKLAYVFRGITEVDSWDQLQGDAQLMSILKDNTYDFIHSSHYLEHMVDPHIALRNWIRITKPGGYLVITVPEEGLYEHFNWPSRFNGDHKWSFSIGKSKGGMPKATNVMELLMRLTNIEVQRIVLIDDFFNPADASDQTRTITTECSIEIILKKTVA